MKFRKKSEKLALGTLRSHLSRLGLALTLHKFLANVDVLVGGCDKPLQGRGTGAIGAPPHRHRTIPRP